MDKTSYKIAVVGNHDTILPFKLIGFQTFPVKEAQETVNTLRRLAREDFGIIYLTEDMAADIPETLAYYDQLEIPALVLIPTHKGSTGLALSRIHENVEKAVGQSVGEAISHSDGVSAAPNGGKRIRGDAPKQINSNSNKMLPRS